MAIDDLTGAGVPGALAAFFGREQVEEANGAGLFLISLDQGLPTNGEYLVRLSAPGFRETTHRFNTAMGDVLNRQQAFDPLTDDNMILYSEGNIQDWAQRLGVELRPTTGVIIGRITPGQADVVITPTGADPASLGTVFYFDSAGNPANLGKTTNASAFVFFPDCAQNPGGEIFLNASAIAPDPQNNDIFSTGRAVAYCRPGEVFIQTIAITPRPVGSTSFTVAIDGEVKPEEEALQSREQRCRSSDRTGVPVPMARGNSQFPLPLPAHRVRSPPLWQTATTLLGRRDSLSFQHTSPFQPARRVESAI
ncbi:MAG: hypothetical protein MPW14_07830 [Candidatus Manganitrophus sp.]|nr:MAG: hypothetical protein MPW14_07830 [Candidatus Manganitrophus sp.]